MQFKISGQIRRGWMRSTGSRSKRRPVPDRVVPVPPRPLLCGVGFSTKCVTFHIMYASCGVCIFVLVAPLHMYDISKCSSLSALGGGIVSMHVTIHIDALILVAKVTNVINCSNLLICLFHSILCVYLLSIMSIGFRSIFMPSVQWCNSCIFVCPMVTRTNLQSVLHAVADFL